jgi:hypothetical protein
MPDNFLEIGILHKKFFYTDEPDRQAVCCGLGPQEGIAYTRFRGYDSNRAGDGCSKSSLIQGRRVFRESHFVTVIYLDT